LLAACDTAGIQGTANDVVPHPGQVPHTTTPDQHRRVLLEVVPLARNVRRHYHTVAKAHTGDLAERRVGLLRSHGADLGAHPTLLGRPLTAPQTTGIPTQRVVGVAQRRRLGLLADPLPPFSDQLVDRRHVRYPFSRQPFSSCRRALRRWAPQLRRRLSLRKSLPHWSGRPWAATSTQSSKQPAPCQGNTGGLRGCGERG